MGALTWTGTGGDWTTATDWNSKSVPTNTDSALISTNVWVWVGTTDNSAIQNVTLNAASAMFEIDGTLTASGSVTIGAGVLTLKGSLSAAAITDNATIAW